MREGDRVFGATIAQVYESHLVPLLFEPYAARIADLVAELRPARVLEVAAGTGVLTRAMSSRLATATGIVATDLNQAMLDQGMAVGTRRPVQWRQADAQALPFDDADFDVVVCQFGVMFFPDKQQALAEARRVLVAGGTLLFTVWDRIEENDFADTVATAVGTLFPQNPPTFLQRTPHGYFDPSTIVADLRGAGFGMPANVVTVAERSRATSPRVPAVAYCEGTPMRSEVEARGGGVALAEASRRAEEALASRFGRGAVEGRMQALVVSVVR